MDNPTSKQQHVIRNWQASPLGLRVSEHTEMVGLDISEHSAYPRGFYLINYCAAYIDVPSCNILGHYLA